MDSKAFSKPIYVVDGARTPFLKARTERGPFSAADLAVTAGQSLLARQPFSPEAIDEVIVGCMMPSEDEANIGRIVGLRLGCGDKTPGWTVQRNCASGMQAIDSAMKDIAIGRADLVLAGGTEAMSRAPLLFRPEMANWFGRFARAKGLGAKFSSALEFRPRFLKPIIALLRGLSDPLCNLNMGQTAELVAYQFGVKRDEMDAYAVRSHHAAAAAADKGHYTFLAPLYGADGKCYDNDDGVRRDSNATKLATLKPVFDRRYGMVTAANSSQVSDGSSMLLLASEEAVQKYQLKVLGKITDVQWAGLDPKVMGLGPVMASTPILQRHGLSLNDIDYWEINEAFAAQLLGCLRAWEDADFCKQHFGMDHALGKLNLDKVNVDGGAIAIGHPVGATGARIVLHLLDILHREQKQRGIATLCIGGGQGGAMLVERV